MTTQDSTTYDAADQLAPISSSSTVEQLQEVMDMARIAANAQRDLEAAGENPLDEAEGEETPATDAQPGESATEAPAEQAPESVDAEQAEEEADEEPAEAPPSESTPQPTDEQKYSRRDAARFKTELDTAKQTLQQVKAQLAQHQASDSAIITRIVEQAGSEEDYRKLVDKVVAGQASDEERQRANIMQQWRTVAGPIYRQAQQQVTTAWGYAFQAAGQYDGMTDETRQRMNAAVDPQQALETIHAAGLSAGAEQARAQMKADAQKLQAENQRLKAELSSVKSKQAAAQPQPATPDGASPASMPKLPPMFLEDGVTLNPEFEKLASSGKLYGVEKLTG